MKKYISMAIAGLIVCSVIAHGKDKHIGLTPERSRKQRLQSGIIVVVSEPTYEPRSIGSYSILLYDDPDFIDYVDGCVRHRDGDVEELLFADFNGDKEEDIVVTIRCAGSGSYLSADVFLIKNKKLEQLKLPTAEEHFFDGYRGHDIFDVVDGMIYWQFPLYRPEDCNARPTGGTKCLELAFGKKNKKKWRLSNHRIDSDSK